MTEACGHNFCHDCLSRYIAAQEYWNCPECRSEQVKRADDFLRNRLAEKAVEQYNAAKIKTQSKPLCSYHDMEFSICKSLDLVNYQ